MSAYLLNFIKGTVQRWYIPLIVGILFIILGIISLINPTTSFFTLGILFSLSFMIGGVIEVIFSLENRYRLYNWGLKLGMGILTFLIGLLLFLKPEISLLTLALYVGFLVLFRSFSAISFALDFKRYYNNGWVGLLIWGILGVIISFFLLWNPVWAALYLVVLIAISIIFTGLFNIYYALELRKVKRITKKISPEIRERITQLKRDLREED